MWLRRHGWLATASTAVALLALGNLKDPLSKTLPLEQANIEKAQEIDSPELRAERVGLQWRLTWNRNARIVQTASIGRLQLTDGYYQKEIMLDQNDLRTGQIVYSPLTGEINFRLELFGAPGQKGIGESVRAIAVGSPGHDLTADLAADRVLNQRRPSRTAMTSGRNATPDSADADREEMDKAAESSESNNPITDASQSFSMPAAATTAEFGTPPALLDPMIVARQKLVDLPIPGPSSASAPNDLIFGSLIPGELNQPQTQVAPPLKPAAAPERSKVEKAVLIRRQEPSYPSEARQAGVSGTVQVDAIVGTNGHVTAARSVNGPLMLREAAVAAVMGFQYKPASRNGKPIESQTLVNLVFRLNK
jgi:TonB family protein